MPMQTMQKRVGFVAHEAIDKDVRERYLRELRSRGLEVKPLVANPFTRAHALLDFIRLIEEQECSICVCLDEKNGICARMIAGHTHIPVLAVFPLNNESGRSVPTLPPLTIADPPTAEAVATLVMGRCAMGSPRHGDAHTQNQVPSSYPETCVHATKSKFTEEDARWIENLSQQFRPKLVESKRRSISTPKSSTLDFSLELRHIISLAKTIAEKYKHQSISPLHYLAAIIEFRECAAHDALLAAGLDTALLFEQIVDNFPPGEAPDTTTIFAPNEDATALVGLAKQIARKRQRKVLTTSDLLEGMIHQAGSQAEVLLASFGVDKQKIDELIVQQKLRGEELPVSPAPRKTILPDQIVEFDPAVVSALESRLLSQRLAEKDKSRAVETALQEEAILIDNNESERKSISLKNERSNVNEPATEKTRSPLILRCDALSPALEVIEHAADSLLEGKIVAFPTDTVYGIAVDATNRDALEKLYSVKGRERTRAIAILIHSTTLLKNIVREIPEGVDSLIEEFWPGPLTLVFKRPSHSFSGLSQDDTIGIRIPNNYVALSILSMVCRPLATTSANISGRPDATNAQEVLAQLGSSIDLIVDGGPAGGGAPSTVLSVVEKPYRILRQGPVTREQLEKVIKVPIVD